MENFASDRQPDIDLNQNSTSEENSDSLAHFNYNQQTSRKFRFGFPLKYKSAKL